MNCVNILDVMVMCRFLKGLNGAHDFSRSKCFNPVLHKPEFFFRPGGKKPFQNSMGKGENDVIQNFILQPFTR